MPVETAAAVLRAFGEPHAVEKLELRDPGPGEVRVRMVAAGCLLARTSARRTASGRSRCRRCWGMKAQAWWSRLARVSRMSPPGSVSCSASRPVVESATTACSGGRSSVKTPSTRWVEGRLLTGPTPIRNGDGDIATYSLLGCFAGHVVVSARSAVPLPDGVPADVAALVGCAVITGFGAATESIDIAAGTRGAVIGAGEWA